MGEVLELEFYRYFALAFLVNFGSIICYFFNKRFSYLNNEKILREIPISKIVFGQKLKSKMYDLHFRIAEEVTFPGRCSE